LAALLYAYWLTLNARIFQNVRAWYKSILNIGCNMNCAKYYRFIARVDELFIYIHTHTNENAHIYMHRYMYYTIVDLHCKFLFRYMDVIERAFIESLYILGTQLLIYYHCHCFRIDMLIYWNVYCSRAWKLCEKAVKARWWIINALNDSYIIFVLLTNHSYIWEMLRRLPRDKEIRPERVSGTDWCLGFSENAICAIRYLSCL